MKNMKIMKILKLMIFEALPLSDDCFGAPERCASAQCSKGDPLARKVFLIIAYGKKSGDYVKLSAACKLRLFNIVLEVVLSSPSHD